MRILVLGITGMLGHTLFQILQESDVDTIWGTVRSLAALKDFPVQAHANIIQGIDVLDENALLTVFESIRPDVVINCIGVIKQLASSKDPLTVLPINALFPHRLAKLCALSQARLIHISTDCVFSGKKGFYSEQDPSDADDLYGKSKYMGELVGLPHAVTLRTSIIGHELHSNRSLVDWFLSQHDSVKGYNKAIFSGFPSNELARVIRDYVIPNSDLFGLYHVATNPINKYDLLRLISAQYQKDIAILPDDGLNINRALNAEQFNQMTGYYPPEWPLLIEHMYQAHRRYSLFIKGIDDV